MYITIVILDLVWLNTVWDKPFLLFLFIILFSLDDLPSHNYEFFVTSLWSTPHTELLCEAIWHPLQVTKSDYIVSFCLFGLPSTVQCFWLLFKPKSTIFEGFEATWNIFWNKLHLFTMQSILLSQIQAASTGLQFGAIQLQRSNFLTLPFWDRLKNIKQTLQNVLIYQYWEGEKDILF